jgi:riboflavin biosynthesis pyrimidine reductase
MPRSLMAVRMRLGVEPAIAGYGRTRALQPRPLPGGRSVRLMVADTVPIGDPLSLYTVPRIRAGSEGCWVVANMVAGLDGSAAVHGRVGALSSPRDAQLFERMRAIADVVLVGAETVRRERYGALRRPDDVDTGTGRDRAQLRVAVVSASLELPAELPLFRDADPERPPIVVTTERSDVDKLGGLPVEVIIAGAARVDVRRALVELAARQLHVVLCEGGPSLLGAVIAADLLDEYLLTLAPLVGGDRLPVVDTTEVTELRTFRLAHVAEEDGSLFLRFLRGGSP